MSSPGAVADALGVSKADRPTLDRLAALGAPGRPVELPAPDAARELLALLGVADEDAAAIVAATPAPDAHPAEWWLIERCVADLERGMGVVEDKPPWPALPAGGGALNRLLYAYVFLAATPQIRAWHAARGIDDDISWATLGDLGLHTRLYRRRHGAAGFDEHNWLSYHYTGVIYRLGRLQFERAQIIFDPGSANPPLPLRADEPALAVHIPADEPLTPEACDRSLAAALPFFRRHFPEEPYRIAGCGSWLLDEQLAEYLPADSNIVRFQRRFAPAPAERWIADEELCEAIYRRPLPASLDELPQRTALERAFVRHLRTGRHWYGRVGWMLLERNAEG